MEEKSYILEPGERGKSSGAYLSVACSEHGETRRVKDEQDDQGQKIASSSGHSNRWHPNPTAELVGLCHKHRKFLGVDEPRSTRPA